MTTLVEGTHPGGFLVWEAFRDYTRETITVASGTLEPGTVLGKITASGKYAAHDPAAVDGAVVLAGGNPQVVVLRTFSKAYGLAGLRVGYAIGDPRILAAARSTGIPLSVTAHAEAAALARQRLIGALGV